MMQGQLEHLRRICLAMPEAVEKLSHGKPVVLVILARTMNKAALPFHVSPHPA